MIRKDRLELNERFVHVFKLLEERGVIIKNDRNGKGMGDFADVLLGNRAYGHIIRAYLNADDKRVISYSQARLLCREYGVNESYMLDGEGSPFGMDLPPQPSSSGDTFQGNILFTTTEAFAGSQVDMSFAQESNQYFAIPNLNGNGLVAFPIKGNSMEPIIQDGDMVIVHGGRVTHLKMISANHLEHDPFVEEVSIHTRLYKVIRRITNL